MSNKKTLIEANIFAKLLSLFYDKRSKGQEDNLKKAINVSNNKEFDRAYAAWKSDSEKLLLSTRELLKKSGQSTSKIDALLKKYHNY